MYNIDSAPTKVLIVEQDEASFQVHKCLVKALRELPPVELYHAKDATEALAMLERFNPDVVLLDDEEPEEQELFMDSLSRQHPPIVILTDHDPTPPQHFSLHQEITRIPRTDTLEGLHQTIMLTVAIGVKYTGHQVSGTLH